MKLYTVNNLDNGGFMDDTRQKPLTANQLRSRFWSLEDSRTDKFKHFTLDYIAETWHVKFERIE